MHDQELELRAWVKSNRKSLLKWNCDELGYLATLCLPDIERSIIHRIIPELYRDLQTHSTIELRLDFHVKKETDYIREFHEKKPLLDEQWHSLYYHQERGEDWIV